MSTQTRQEESQESQESQELPNTNVYIKKYNARQEKKLLFWEKPIYYRKIKGKTFEKGTLSYNYQVASNLWSNIADLIITLPDDFWLMGPIYKGVIPGVPEIQPCVTGKCKTISPTTSETFTQGIRRELHEEIGLTNAGIYCVDSIKTDNRVYNLWALPVIVKKGDNLSWNVSVAKTDPPKGYRDIDSNRVGAVIFGKLNNIKHLVDELSTLWKNEDNITGVGMVSVYVIKALITQEKGIIVNQIDGIRGKCYP